jgi:hypothetical protein
MTPRPKPTPSTDHTPALPRWARRGALLRPRPGLDLSFFKSGVPTAARVNDIDDQLIGLTILDCHGKALGCQNLWFQWRGDHWHDNDWELIPDREAQAEAALQKINEAARVIEEQRAILEELANEPSDVCSGRHSSV